MDTNTRRRSPQGRRSARSHADSTEVVTYRLGERMVYVTPAETFEQAVAFAKRVFPDQLATIDRKRITFTVSVVASHERRMVEIGPMAWKAVVSTLAQYEIINVIVQPEASGSDDGLPDYLDATSTDSKRSSMHLDLPSPSDAKSRSPSPTPSRTEKALSWLERHLP
ncbi:uncharacterized protein LAESUDRAFT_732400, partial [Laetiporus sulphureus 93-53]